MRLALAIALMSVAASAGAQLYRWTDEKGKLHFSDTPPPAGARDVQKKAVGAGPAETAENVPFALRQPMKDFPVTFYSASSCDGCGPVRQLLNARGVPFKEVSVTTNEDIAALTRAAGSAGVPAVLVGPTVIKGYDEDGIHRALDVAGYPKTGAMPARAQAAPKPAEAKPAAKPPAEAPAPAKKSPYYSGG